MTEEIGEKPVKRLEIRQPIPDPFIEAFPVVLALLLQSIILLVIVVNQYMVLEGGYFVNPVIISKYLLASIAASTIGIAVPGEIKLFKLAREWTALARESSRLEGISELVARLRALRHGFGNHIQVIHGLVRLGRKDRARFYIDQVLEDIEQGSFWQKHVQ